MGSNQEDHHHKNGSTNGAVTALDHKSSEEEAYKPANGTVESEIIRQVGPPYEWRIVWKRVIFMTIMHVGGVYGLITRMGVMDWRTLAFSHFWGYMSVVAITAGAHRLWAHKAYKAKLPLRIFLMLASTIAYQGHLLRWGRDHRQHHKFSDTDADPSNSTRGFFFSHMGWLFVKKHPDAYRQKKQMDISDLKKDPVVMFQYKYYHWLVLLLWGIIPATIPVYYWNEDVWTSIMICVMWRYTFSLQGTFMVNSAAHLWGYRPFNKKMAAAESHITVLSLLGMGEGWHNFHHAFPQDYRISELGWFGNMGTALIDIMHKLGQAYDLKFLTEDQLGRTKYKYGDGSRPPQHGIDHYFKGFEQKNGVEDYKPQQQEAKTD